MYKCKVAEFNIRVKVRARLPRVLLKTNDNLILTTMQELASDKGKYQVLNFIFVCIYMGTFVFVSLSLMICYLTLFILFFPFMFHLLFFLFSLYSATGLLAVCHHLKEHQVPFSGRLYIAKHRGMESVQTLFLFHTQIYACTCTLKCQPNMN